VDESAASLGLATTCPTSKPTQPKATWPIHCCEGVAALWLWALSDGPFPEHYEPIEAVQRTTPNHRTTQVVKAKTPRTLRHSR